MDIVFNPKHDPRNLYPEIIVDLLKDNNIRVFSLKELFSSFNLYRRVKIVHLNWYENIVGESFLKIWISFFLKVCVLLLLRVNGKSIIWTMHNKLPHGKNKLHIQKKLMILLIKFSSTIIVHSKVSEKYIFELVSPNEETRKKIKYVPHPDYIHRYGSIVIDKKKEAKLNLLFIGAVKPYKNIEILIDLAKKYSNEINLSISGKSIPDSYSRELIERGKNNSNILFNLDYVKDEDLPVLLSKSDILVLPYDMTSSLNSGAVLLAFSYERAVICSAIGTVEDEEINKINLIYKYKNHQDHFQALENKIKQAIKMKKDDQEIFRKKGKLCYDFIQNNNSDNLVSNGLVSIYKNNL